MPLYDYQCRACGEVFEVRATFKEKEQGLHPRCPACQSPETEQGINAPLVLRVGAGDGASPTECGCGPNAGTGCCSR